jgi:cytochrome o ubiquinol oxidase subunit 2
MRTLLVLALSCLVLFLLGYMSTTNMGVFNPKGLIAIAEKNLIVTAFSLMLIPVIPIFAMLAFFSWRYRASNTKAKYTPDWHRNVTLEIIWWTIPTVIIIILAVITWRSTHYLDPYQPLVSDVKPITIEVVALDWKWLFIYPEENIATVNYVQFPKNTPVNFKITADAPMNGFWIPQLAGQVYAMTGMTAQLHVIANETGDYNGASSNFSGDGFSGMKFVAHVSSQSEYDRWLKVVRLSTSTLTLDEYRQLEKKTKNNPVTYYASVAENLYTHIIMKFMSPVNNSEAKMNQTTHTDMSTSTEPTESTSTNEMHMIDTMNTQ